jgi:hypothetical protein
VREELRQTGFVRGLSDIFDEVASLLRLELQLAKAEISQALAAQVRGAVYLLSAAMLCFIALLLLCESAVFALVEYGLRPSLAALLVAACAVVIAVIGVIIARASYAQSPLPHRTIENLKRDVSVAQEPFK